MLIKCNPKGLFAFLSSIEILVSSERIDRMRSSRTRLNAWPKKPGTCCICYSNLHLEEIEYATES